MIYVHIKNANGNIIASNIKEFRDYKKFSENKNFSSKKINVRSGFKENGGMSIWLIAVNEKDFIISKKRFDILMDSYIEASKMFLPYYTSKIKAHSHTLRTLQGQMKQKMESFIEPKKFRGKSFKEQVDNVEKNIIDKTEETSELICYINKRIWEIEAHIEGFDLLYTDNFTGDIKIKKVNIKKVLQNIAAPFLEEFSAMNIYVNIDIDDDYAQKYFILLNYKIFHLAMYNFFSNAVKYTKDSSRIDITFKVSDDNIFEIFFSMLSCRIEKEERDKIFNDGYSGVNTITVDAGDGTGMFVMKKSLEVMDMTIRLETNYSISENDDIRQYVQNNFIISGKVNL